MSLLIRAEKFLEKTCEMSNKLDIIMEIGTSNNELVKTTIKTKTKMNKSKYFKTRTAAKKHKMKIIITQSFTNGMKSFPNATLQVLLRR